MSQFYPYSIADAPRALSPAFSRGVGGHHRAYRGATDEWLTPPELIAALGPFDLDPCSPVDRPWPTAAEHFTIQDNGLSKAWAGRVWLNPPYGPQTGLWLRKLAHHGNGIALVFARTETAFFQDWAFDCADAILFMRGRINFHHVSGVRSDANAGGPSALIAYGDINVVYLRACEIPGKLVEFRRVA